jgi:hypothetical protein
MGAAFAMIQLGCRSRLLSVAAAAALAGTGALVGSYAASSPAVPAADATPAPYGDLQLASTTATRSYGSPTSIVGDCTSKATTFETTASLSADGSGDGVLTIGTENLGNEPHSVYETSASQLELDYSGSGPDGSESYSATSTFEGYGTSFSGTYTLTIPAPEGSCTVTRPQSLTLTGSGLTLVAPPTTTTTGTTTTGANGTGTTTSTTGTTISRTGAAGPLGTPAPSAPIYPCSTGLITPCSVTGITLSGTPFNPVDGYIPQGSAEYKQLLALGFIPVSGECDEACVIEVQALLSTGQLKLGSSANAAATHLESLGKARLKIQHGTASVRLRFTKAGKRLLREVTAKSFEIELKLWATTPSGKSLGKTKVVYLDVARK